MDYCDPVNEEILVDVCIHGMTEEYKVFLKNLSFPSFSKLMEERDTALSLYDSPRGLARAPKPAKLLWVNQHEEDNGIHSPR